MDGYSGFPLGLESLENGKAFSSQGIFDQTGKVGKNHTKYWKTGNFRQMLFLVTVIFKMICVLFGNFNDIFSSKLND